MKLDLEKLLRGQSLRYRVVASCVAIVGGAAFCAAAVMSSWQALKRVASEMWSAWNSPAAGWPRPNLVAVEGSIIACLCLAVGVLFVRAGIRALRACRRESADQD